MEETKDWLEEIKTSYEAIKSDWGDPLPLSVTTEDASDQAKIWYNDGDLCATVDENLGYGGGVEDIANYLAIAANGLPRLIAEVERLRDALDKIYGWANAYPVDIFPEPDFERVRELLEAGGITLDAVSASNMRHVLKGIKDVAKGR